MDINSVDLDLLRISDTVYTEGNVSRTAIRWLRTEYVVRQSVACWPWEVEGACGAQARGKRDQRKPSKRMAFCFRIRGMTSGRKPATWKSCIQRSGVIKG